MKVVHIATAHLPFDTRIFHKEARSLSAAGHDVTVVVHHDGDTSEHGVDVAGLGEYDSRRERMSNVWRAFRRAKELSADVYHFHDPELLPVGLLLKLTTDAKVVYDIHEDFDNQIQFKEWIPAPLRPIIANTIVPVQSLFAHAFDGLVAANEWIAADFERRGHDVTVVGNFPIIEDADITYLPNERDHEYVLSFVGNIDETHGLLDMLEVVSRLRSRGYDVGIWVIGPIDEPLRERATQYIERESLDPHVRLFGRIDYTEIFSYLHTSDVGMMLVDPDLYEHGLSNKMFEYMYSEIPVVAHATTSTRKYIPEECGVHVDETDTETQTEAVASLLDLSQAERDDMGARARRHVVENCTWENEAEKLLELYESL
jgi:glycosyltransferase involved in cell wall biosynthesis